MDPNVQVALVSVISTFITTCGVIIVAVKNNQKERTKAAEAGVVAGLDETDVLGRMLTLISENERKDKVIAELRADIKELRAKLREEKKAGE